MKTKTEILQNFLKGMLFGFVSLTIAATLIGCGKSRDNNDNNYPRGAGWWGGGYGYGGPGYNGYGQITDVSAGVDNEGRFMVILAGSVDQSYSGVGYVEGELRLYMPMPCITSPGIGLNAGVYQLIPYSQSPSGYYMGGFQNVQLIARGPGGEALVTIPYAYNFHTNVCGFDGMQGSLYVQSVNGMQCGRQLFFSDQLIDPGMCR